ncbi:hypothetical protein TNCV_12361 [Trichonephila clavipes]|nr:hypothetical protein TNCV_12361 [Trichonephila clavipes]
MRRETIIYDLYLQLRRGKTFFPISESNSTCAYSAYKCVEKQFSSLLGEQFDMRLLYLQLRRGKTFLPISGSNSTCAYSAYKCVEKQLSTTSICNCVEEKLSSRLARAIRHVPTLPTNASRNNYLRPLFATASRKNFLPD